MRVFAAAVLLLLAVGCSSKTVVYSEPPGGGEEEKTTTTPESVGAPRAFPQLSFDAEAGGCRSLVVYRANADGTQYAVISIDREQLGLTVGEAKTFDLGHEPAGIDVRIDVYANPPGEVYCTDYASGAATPVAHWPAEAGSLTIQLSPDPEGNGNGTYRASIRLERLHLTSPEGGSAAVVPKIVIEDVRVGWLPG